MSEETVEAVEEAGDAAEREGESVTPAPDQGTSPEIEEIPAGDPLLNQRIVEAYIFASADPVTERALANRLPKGTDIRAILEEIKAHYADRGVHLVHVGESWAFRTAPDLTTKLSKEVEVSRKMSRAAIEILAIVAYHQPVTRTEIEEIRGVSLSKGTLDSLFELGWIKPRGRRKTPGRPLTWGTSDDFLDHFGLESINDLPGIEELNAAGLLDKRPAIHAYRGVGAEEEPLGTEDVTAEEIGGDEALDAGELRVVAPETAKSEGDDRTPDQDEDDETPDDVDDSVDSESERDGSRRG